MQDLRFNVTTMTMAAAIGSRVRLPLSIGRLSDRLGHKLLIVLYFSTMPLGLAVLATAGQFWQLWVASIL